MKTIKTIHLNHLRNEAHYQFLTLYKNLLNQFAEAKSVVSNLYNDFVALLNKEASLVDAIKASDYTRPVCRRLSCVVFKQGSYLACSIL
ncbi:hypothetical protein FACS189456_3010 [Bacteroidia bacterium]|nr:hypothetical protein FACS189456_3010 [Bacteroidia bacterium]